MRITDALAVVLVDEFRVRIEVWFVVTIAPTHLPFINFHFIMFHPCIVYHLLSNTVDVVLLANVKSAHVPVADVAEALNSSKFESNFRVSQFGRVFHHFCAFGFACLPRRVGVAI